MGQLLRADAVVLLHRQAQDVGQPHPFGERGPELLTRLLLARRVESLQVGGFPGLVEQRSELVAAHFQVRDVRSVGGQGGQQPLQIAQFALRRGLSGHLLTLS